MPPLLRLPGELRSRIYGYVLCNKTWELDQHDQLLGFRRSQDLRSAFEIVRVCRQTHADTTLLSFAGSIKGEVGTSMTYVLNELR